MPEPQRTDRSEQNRILGVRRYTLARSCTSTYEHFKGFSKACALARAHTGAAATRDTLADRVLNRRINPSISYARFVSRSRHNLRYLFRKPGPHPDPQALFISADRFTPCLMFFHGRAHA